MTTHKKQPKKLGGAQWGSVMTPLQDRIIAEWLTKELVHPSYATIARRLGCTKEPVHRAIKKYLALTKK